MKQLQNGQTIRREGATGRGHATTPCPFDIGKLIRHQTAQRLTAGRVWYPLHHERGRRGIPNLDPSLGKNLIPTRRIEFGFVNHARRSKSQWCDDAVRSTRHPTLSRGAPVRVIVLKIQQNRSASLMVSGEPF